MNSSGRLPKRFRQYTSSSLVSAMWVCMRTPSLRASSAVLRMSDSETVNGEHGASATRSIEPGRGS